MKPLDIHPLATAEANDAVDYYNAEQSGLGDEFREEPLATLRRLQENPLLYPVERGQTRVVIVGRFPYSALYRILPDRIWVGAVRHHKRRPNYWVGRRPR